MRCGVRIFTTTQRQTYIGRWPEKTSHGVRVRLTAASMARRSACCAEPGEKSCSVLIWMKAARPWRKAYHGLRCEKGVLEVGS